ncbi:MAG: hypothetical protein WCL16_04185 [bacterium]
MLRCIDCGNDNNYGHLGVGGRSLKFDFGFRTGRYANFTADIHHNLKTGHPVLALVPGLKHWVVITGMDQKGVWVADSIGYIDPDCLGRLSFKISHREFGDQVCGVVLVTRRKGASIRGMTNTDFVREYIRGAKFGAGCLHKVVPPWLKWIFTTKPG